MGMFVFFYRNEMLKKRKSSSFVRRRRCGGRRGIGVKKTTEEKRSSSSIWIVPGFRKNLRRCKKFVFFDHSHMAGWCGRANPVRYTTV